MSRARYALVACCGALLLVAGYGLGLVRAKMAAYEAAKPFLTGVPAWFAAINAQLGVAKLYGLVLFLAAIAVFVYLEVAGDGEPVDTGAD